LSRAHDLSSRRRGQTVRIACPFCGIAGEIPDSSRLKPLKCRQCGTKFHPRPPPFAKNGVLSSHDVGCCDTAIDVAALIPPPPIDLGIKTDEGLNVYGSNVAATSKRTKTIGPLKFVLTAFAILINLVLLGITFSGLAHSLHILHEVGDRPARIITDDGQRFVQIRSDALLSFGFSLTAVFFVGSIPLLGSYASYAKRRGLAEGYDLSTFFGPLGLIVMLCLPANRDHD
jgi:hypothetical protein